MAFDQPMEADRIDDFNLFSAFVRAPLWILGGVLGNNASRLDEDPAIPRRLDAALDPSDCRQPKGLYQFPLVSDENLSCAANTATRDNDKVNASCHVQNEAERLRKSAAVDGCQGGGLKRSKNLSWSDQSGHRLVEYNDESNVLHEPSPYHSATSTTVPKAMKSAIKRSRSVRGGEEQKMEGATSDRTRYIPKMNHRSENNKGLIMPTRPYGGSDATNNGGIESPQWGWYTNLTPPSPEMYHSHFSKASSKSQVGVASPPFMPSGKCGHNQVFQHLQNSKAPVGWTSVPI